jgi:hypothetical protein
VKIRFNESLNVLIGGRGTGKSTAIESLRYVLGIRPLVTSARQEHDAMVKDVLGSGTKIRLELQVRRPAPATYTVERLIGQPPVVRDSTKAVLGSEPIDLLPGLEVYGQRELAELARNKQQLTTVLARYLPAEMGKLDGGERDLAQSRQEIVACQADIKRLTKRLAPLPVVTERLTRFDAAGVPVKLQEQDVVRKEEDLLLSATSSLAKKNLALLDQLLLDMTNLAAETVDPLPRGRSSARQERPSTPTTLS